MQLYLCFSFLTRAAGSRAKHWGAGPMKWAVGWGVCIESNRRNRKPLTRRDCDGVDNVLSACVAASLDFCFIKFAPLRTDLPYSLGLSIFQPFEALSFLSFPHCCAASVLIYANINFRLDTGKLCSSFIFAYFFRILSYSKSLLLAQFHFRLFELCYFRGRFSSRR